jgi:hypothetical protein
MAFLGLILDFMISKEKKNHTPRRFPKKVQAIVNMPMPINPHQIQAFNGMA